MCFDFIVLCLTGIRLHTSSAGHSRIGTLIFADGLVYFIVAYVVMLFFIFTPPIEIASSR